MKNNINAAEKKSRSFKFARRNNPRVYNIYTWSRSGGRIECPIVAANFKEVRKAVRMFTSANVYAADDPTLCSYTDRKPMIF